LEAIVMSYLLPTPPDRRRQPALIALVTALLLTNSAFAHHAAAIFDRGTIIEVEGEITEVRWVNPHVRLKMLGAVPGGAVHEWDIESNSVSIVSRFGLSAEQVPVGVRVKVAGFGAQGRDDMLWITNMLLPDGSEVLFGSRIEPRWSQTVVGSDIRGAVTADTEGRGIFRVWTSASGIWNNRMSLTPAAEAARLAFDPVAGDPTLNCVPKGMPYIMEQPYPIEFVDDGEAILLKLEEYDTVRYIIMTPRNAVARERARSPLGTSFGIRDGDVLAIETIDIEYPYLNGTGIPLGREVRTDETFRLNADGSRLEYTLTVTDPTAFTTPASFAKSWEWRPGEEVKPYDCQR
jgi:hypothetical protein